MEQKAKKRKKVLKHAIVSAPGPGVDNTLAEFGTQQIGQIVRTSVAIYTYQKRDIRISDIFKNLFKVNNTSNGFLVSPTFFHLDIKSNSKKAAENIYGIFSILHLSLCCTFTACQYQFLS